MKSDDMIAKTIKKAAEAKVARAAKVKVTTLPAQYMGTDSEGKGWVMLPGANGPTPVRRMAVEAKAGDTVAVTVGYGRAVVDSNISNPSAGVAGVTTVRRTAQQAQSTATEAAKDAQAAIGYATTARAAANDARSQADVAAAEAQSATNSAQTALAASEGAVRDASTAHEMAAAATSSAATAYQAAADARQSANRATYGLSEVESVIGTLTWIAEHGEHVSAAGTAFDPERAYYTRSGSGTEQDPYVYAVVAEPVAGDIGSYYYLRVDESVQTYIASHIYLLDDGLYVSVDGSGHKARVSSSSFDVVEQDGAVSASFGAGGIVLGKVGESHAVVTADGMTVSSANIATIADLPETIAEYAGITIFQAAYLAATLALNCTLFTDESVAVVESGAVMALYTADSATFFDGLGTAAANVVASYGRNGMRATVTIGDLR